MLLMISNNNMSLRELYTTMLDSHPAGWATSFMSGLPDGIEGLVAGYDALIYELGAADTAERISNVTQLLKTEKPVITHVEGRQAPQRAAELTEAGAYVVANPVTAGHIEEALNAITATLRRPKPSARRGLGGHVRRLFKGT
jgi:hypothetical protein